MDSTLGIGLSALLAAQKAIDTAGHNIANAHTPNFTRQRVQLVSIAPNRLGPMHTGAGVRPIRVEAIRDAFIERALLSQDPMAGAATRRSYLLGDIERLFPVDPEANLGAVMDDFFNSFRALARNPAGAAERAAVVQHAQALTGAFNDLGDRLAAFRRDLAPYAEGAVRRVNDLAARIASLNAQIRDTAVTHGEANDLIDQRTTALRDLATLVPITVTYDNLGRADVRAAGLLLVAKDHATELTATAESGAIEVRVGSSMPFDPGGGELGALLDVANLVVPDYLARLDALAATIVREVNLRHTTGVGRGGSFTSLVSTQTLDDSAALDDAGLPFALQAGDLYVSVIDQATGEVTQARLAINPSSDTLADLAAALGAVDHLAARVAGGRLQVTAEAGYTFDFTNRVPSHPGTLGTATPTLAGHVTLDASDVYTFTADAAGTIGTTPGLTVTVTDAAGLTVAMLEVGEGYEPGQALELPGGLTVSFSAGDVAASDAFSAELAAEPDAQGFLAALGLNTFFGGTSAAGMTLEAAVAADPSRIAAGWGDASGDNRNALRMAGVQDAAFASLGDDTVDGHYAELIGQVGLDSQMAQRGAASAILLLEAALNQRDAISGVNQDEEAVDLLRFQQLYAFAAKYIQTINKLLDDLMTIL